MKTRRDFLGNLVRALNLIWQCARGLTVASVALVLLQGLLPLAGLYIMKLLVDTVTHSFSAADKDQAFVSVALLIGFLGLIALLEALCGSLSRLVSSIHAQLVTDHMYDILHAKSLEVDLEYYESPQYHDTLHRAQREAPFRPTRLLAGLTQLIQNGISLIAIAGLLLWLHWGIVALLLIVAIPGALVRLHYANKVHAWERQRTPTERQAWYYNGILTRDTHAKEVRLFNLGGLFMTRFREVRAQLRQQRLKITKKRTWGEFLAFGAAIITVFGLFAFLAHRSLQGNITLGDLVMYYQAIQRGQLFLRDVLNGLAGLYEDNLFLSNLFEFLDLKPRLIEPPHPKSVPRLNYNGIVFDQVSFQYPGDKRKALEKISLTIRPGKHIALVGENGAGKTTLIKLLCRLYDPTDGKITLEGVDLRLCRITELRGQISVIFQDFAPYHLTARENIWLGNIDQPPDDNAITSAARQAGVDQVISGLTNGYETILGKWFEGGEELSTGEWQKLALARAFLRDAQIIVLDEPTSAMDPKAEYEVFKKFHEITRGRTAILISHRLSTVKMADHIYVMENGKIVESGTHDELVYHGARYADLFETQAQYYR
jgi:ATP-binding cassette, subfamily B, bacterial